MHCFGSSLRGNKCHTGPIKGASWSFNIPCEAEKDICIRFLVR